MLGCNKVQYLFEKLLKAFGRDPILSEQQSPNCNGPKVQATNKQTNETSHKAPAEKSLH
jgi:hypothetical protein